MKKQNYKYKYSLFIYEDLHNFADQTLDMTVSKKVIDTNDYQKILSKKDELIREGNKQSDIFITTRY